MGLLTTICSRRRLISRADQIANHSFVWGELTGSGQLNLRSLIALRRASTRPFRRLALFTASLEMNDIFFARLATAMTNATPQFLNKPIQGNEREHSSLRTFCRAVQTTRRECKAGRYYSSVVKSRRGVNGWTMPETRLYSPSVQPPRMLVLQRRQQYCT